MTAESGGAGPAVPAADAVADGRQDTLTGWQKAAVVLAAALALAVFVYGAAGSYDSVWHLAAEHRVQLPRLVPVGIDGGLVLAVLTDIVLTWTGQPLWWLRAAARGFVAGSVAANAAAGWPDPIAVFLHCFAPVIVLMVTEAGRAALLRKHAEADGRDPIPLARWLVSPLPTAAMWRRMVLWGVKSYAKAVTAEVSRRRAIVQLRVRYGRRWRKHAPGDLVWLLRTGNQLEEACARVADITTPGAGARSGGNQGTGNRRNHGRGNRNRGTGSRGGTGNRGNGNNPAWNRNRGTGAGRPANTADLDPVLLAEARRRAAEHRQQNGREITVTELALALGRRKSLAGELLRAVRDSAPQDGPASEARR